MVFFPCIIVLLQADPCSVQDMLNTALKNPANKTFQVIEMLIER